MKNRWIRKIAVFSSVAVLGAQSLTAQAATGADLQNAGVASLITDSSFSEEELIAMLETDIVENFGYVNIGIAKLENSNLNVRAEGNTSAKIVGKMQDGAVCEVLEISEDGWAHITSGEVEGYVSAEFLITGPDARILVKDLVRTVAVATVDRLNVRKEPNTECGIMTKVLKGEEFTYLETLDNGWVKISIDGEEAYVAGEYVEIRENLKTALTMTEVMYGQGVSDVRVDLCEYAKQFLGNPYVWGGTSLTKGCDCSGFVQSIYKKYGVYFSHKASVQATEATKISLSDIKPGDLLFYGSSASNITHVAIYIGDGQIIHASDETTGIIISKYNYRTPVKAVRALYD